MIEKNNSLIFSGMMLDNLFFIEPRFLVLLNIEYWNWEWGTWQEKNEKSIDNDTYLWHLGFGHIHLNRIQRLVKDGALSPLEVQPLPVGESCLKAKEPKNIWNLYILMSMNL